MRLVFFANSVAAASVYYRSFAPIDNSDGNLLVTTTNSLLACQEICTSEAQCVGVSFYKTLSSNNCLIKSSESQLQPAVAVDTFHKLQQADSVSSYLTVYQGKPEDCQLTCRNTPECNGFSVRTDGTGCNLFSQKSLAQLSVLNSTFLSSKRSYTGSVPVTLSANQTWIPVYSNGMGSNVDLGEAATNQLFAQSGIFKRECPICAPTHQLIFYKRISGIPTGWSVYYNIKTVWQSCNNQLNQNFRLFSTWNDLSQGSNGWQFCNYDDATMGGVAFPRDCGPSGAVGCQWNGLHPACPKNSFTYSVLASSGTEVVVDLTGYKFNTAPLVFVDAGAGASAVVTETSTTFFKVKVTLVSGTSLISIKWAAIEN